MNAVTRRFAQIASWAIFALFILGFFFHPIGMWTGPILGVWFVGTQRPRRGFLWMIAFAFIPSLLFGWRDFPLTDPRPALEYFGWMFLAAVLGVLPFTFHRLVSASLPGWLSTMPLPLAVAALHLLAPPPLQRDPAHGIGILSFFIFWFAAVLVWMWNHEFRVSRIAWGAGIFAAAFIVVSGFELSAALRGAPRTQALFAAASFDWTCLAAVAALIVWALLHPRMRPSWNDRPGTVALLQSPFTGNPLHVVHERQSETLVSETGERFPIRDGIPAFLKPEDLTGDNRKYNRLYETIGGFYDDTQRVVSALSGIDRDAYVMSYLGFLEVKPGDSVLETSVGTGLNFKYLPRGARLFGLDLSPEMLANCQANLRRWNLDADLFLGNAESLPFADSSMDVVFHTGGINFFSDRAKAIREMIRVAKPGSRILIADETEEHVKAAYEATPLVSSYYGNRKQAVAPPVDLVPPEMQEIHLEILNVIDKNRFYALTFRKPPAA
jgi:ubiquinone/menaquinone biosynthesis C-methylase UbiE